MKKLIIFDIDGTLINLSELEDQFYIDAVRHALGESVHIGTDWLNYKYSTDSGVFFEITHNQFSRPPSTQEIQKAQDFFVNLLAKSFLKDCALCQCLPGASDIFEQIKCIGGDVAIATGCWKNSAELKLKKQALHLIISP